MYKPLIGLLALLVVAAMIPVAVISFDAPSAPPVMAAMAAPSKQASSDFPVPRQFRARDGTSLQYYAYPAGPEKSPS